MERRIHAGERGGKPMKPGYAVFAHGVRQLRAELGLTQEKFAKRVGVSYVTVNRWENGHHRPSPMAQRYLDGLQGGVRESRGTRSDSSSPGGGPAIPPQPRKVIEGENAAIISGEPLTRRSGRNQTGATDKQLKESNRCRFLPGSPRGAILRWRRRCRRQ